MALLDDWDAFAAWAATRRRSRGGRVRRRPSSAPPVPRPAPGLRDRAELRPHAAEAGYTARPMPLVVHQVPVLHHRARTDGRAARRATSTGRSRSSPSIGRGGQRHRPRARPGTHVAGLTIGQDLSERVAAAGRARRRSSPRQVVSRASARPARGSSPPTSSPTATTSRSRRASTARRCRPAAPSTMIFAVPELVARLSAVVPAAARRPDLHRHAGRASATAAPAALPRARTRRWSAAIEGIGELVTRFA